MSEATTAAPTENAITEVQAPTEVQVEQSTQVEQPQVEQAQVEETPQAEEPDYSYVPKKFLKDGKPDWEALTKSYQHMEKKASQKGVNVPEDVAEYEWTGNAPTPISEEQAASFKAEAQKAGLTKEQYAFVMDKYAEVMTNSGFSADASAHALKQVWGDEFQANVNSARRAFDEFAPSDISLDDPVLNHPTVIRLLASFGRELHEDSQASVKASNGRSSGLTEAEVREIQSSSDYWHNTKKQAQVREWYDKKYK